MEISAPKDWSDLINILKKEKGIAMILGATDTGKSTLAKFLIFNLCKQGLKVSLVDADIGQSFLGPPTTIGLSVFKSDPDWEIVLSPPEIFFVGSTTPEGHFPIFLKGVKRMVEKASSSDTDLILIDTTGFVFGEGGKELKRKKIDLISPQFILALQRSDEIEPILTSYSQNPTIRIFRLPLSDQVKARSMDERRVYRANKFQDYFKKASVQELFMENIQIEGEVLDPNGEPIPLDWALKINGLLIGLKNLNDETLGLGIIRNFSEEKRTIRILTPLTDTKGVKSIQLSSQKVIPSHEEENY
jgi:polynucleotide 5'-hydroxyl-kinase GRC3/NOL9